jgi:hypothetical protein
LGLTACAVRLRESRGTPRRPELPGGFTHLRSDIDHFEHLGIGQRLKECVNSLSTGHVTETVDSRGSCVWKPRTRPPRRRVPFTDGLAFAKRLVQPLSRHANRRGAPRAVSRATCGARQSRCPCGEPLISDRPAPDSPGPARPPPRAPCSPDPAGSRWQYARTARGRSARRLRAR